MVDVAVIGAGPSGALAARELAGQGLEVALLEKAPLPRYKPCGGGIVQRAWSLAQPLDAQGVEVRDLEIWLGRERLVRVHRDQAVLRMVMRADFDRALVTTAESAGARLLCPCKLLGIRKRADRIRLRTSNGELETRFLLAADGAAGPTALLAGWPAQELAVPALEAEVGVSPEELGHAADVVRFDLRSPRRGYSWVFPKREHVSIGVLGTRKPYPRLKPALADYLQGLGVPRNAPVEVHGFVIPVRPRAQPARGRVLLTGDAAGLADPLTLEGISYAMLSGRLAARAIVEAGLVGGAVERSYVASLQRHVLGDLRVGRRLARLLYAESPWIERWMPRLLPRAAEHMTDVFAGQLTMRALWRKLMSLTWLRHVLM